MTDDFFQEVAFRHRANKDAIFPRSIAGDRPFNRSIKDWKVPHPKVTLDPKMFPVVSTLRTGSKWTLVGPPVLPHDYRSGHYVPLGPRSGWTKAQYIVYKEEQASWRRNRDEVRSEGMRKRLQQHRNDMAEDRVVYGNKTKEVRLEDEEGDSRGCLVRSYATSGILALELRNRLSPGPVIDLTANQEGIVDFTGSEDAVSHSEENADEVGDTDCSGSAWEAPDSQASDTEDEFQWLWDRGAKLVHNHWPSVARGHVSEIINRTYITLQHAMVRHHMTAWELSTLKSFKVRDQRFPLTDVVYNKRAVEARAIKFQGGPEVQERYKNALIEREELVERIVTEKVQRELRKLK